MAIYNKHQARNQEQLLKMQDLESKGICIFCWEYVNKEANNGAEYESSNWYVKKNDFPYKNTKLHLLVIPKEHFKTVSELPEEVRREFLDIIAKIEKDHHLNSFAVGIRSGDMRFNGGTIEHLHAHIVVGKPRPGDSEPVRFKMSSYPKD